MDADRGDVTVLLAKLTKGNEEAASKLIPLVYAEMRRLAGAYMRRERSDHVGSARLDLIEADFSAESPQKIGDVLAHGLLAGLFGAGISLWIHARNCHEVL